MIKVGIVGATGYTGAELIRLLQAHPDAEVIAITSRKEAKKAISDIYPHLRGVSDLVFQSPEEIDLTCCDVVFFATPHGVCMNQAPALVEAGVKIIDLSADFRLKDTAVFEKWYKMPHTCPNLLKEAVYGLPEMGNREAIKSARIIGNPGCYPTAVEIGLRPLITHQLIEYSSVIADVKSGISGAGREAKVAHLFAEMGGNFKAYGEGGHRHEPEIIQEISRIAGESVYVTFVPHLLPVIRGIEATIYAPLKKIGSDLLAAFETDYADEVFIDVMGENVNPELRSVRGSNFVRIGVNRSTDGKMAIISVVEDNLVKGAAGQAVQCMNLMMGLAETEGLMQTALMP